MMAAPVPYAFPWPSRTLHGWGRGDSESGIWGCGLCTLPDASRHLLPGAVLACLSCSVCLLQSPLTLSLTQAGLASPATQERKRTRLVGLVSTRLIQPQDALCRGWEYRGLCVTGPEFQLVTGMQLSSQPVWGYFTLLCFSGALDSSRDQAGEKLTCCRAGAPREVGRVTATSKEPCRPQGSVWGRVLSSCRGWTDAALA